MRHGIKFIAWLLQIIQNILESIVVFFLYRPKGKHLRIIKDIHYDKRNNDKHATCEIIEQKESGKRRPIFLYIHGGGWVSGLKKARRFYCYEYAEKGYFVVNCDYAYAPKHSHPYQMQQIFRIIDMLVLRQDEFNIDVDQIVIGGDSAGGYFAAMTSAVASSGKYEQAGVECMSQGKFTIKVNMFMCGAFNISQIIDLPFPGMKIFLTAFTGMTTGMLREAGRTNMDVNEFMTPNFPPSFIIKAERDALKVESDKLERVLSSHGIEYGCYLATGMLSQHCFVLLCRSKQGRQCLNGVQGFIEDYISME